MLETERQVNNWQDFFRVLFMMTVYLSALIGVVIVLSDTSLPFKIVILFALILPFAWLADILWAFLHVFALRPLLRGISKKQAEKLILSYYRKTATDRLLKGKFKILCKTITIKAITLVFSENFEGTRH